MNKCKCGCGADVEEGKQYLKGHWAKVNAKKNEVKPSDEQIQALMKQHPHTEEPKQPEEPKISISNIRACGIKSENVAWFKTAEGYISKELEFYCTITHENKNESYDYVAVVLEDGSIMPAVLLPGFVGIFDQYHTFKDNSYIEEDNPDFAKIKDTKIIPPPEKPAISQPDDSINNAIEELRKISTIPQPEKKKGFIERMLGNATG